MSGIPRPQLPFCGCEVCEREGVHDPYCLVHLADNEALEVPPCDCGLREGEYRIPATTLMPCSTCGDEPN